MDNLLKIEPQVLSFPCELNKQASCTIRLSNMTQKDVAFKVMTTNPNKYTVQPNWGIVFPRSCLDITVTMLDPEVLSREQQCEDKFLIKSAFVRPDATREVDVRKLLDKKDVGPVKKCKLGVIYTFPSQVPSPVAEETASSSSASRVEHTYTSESKMCVKKLLDVAPSELQFPFELNKELTCLLRLKNITENHVIFKVKTTHPTKYCVQPHTGIVLPGSTCDVIVRMLALTETPVDRPCKDKFLIQSMVGSAATTIEELTPKLFDEPGRFVEGYKLGVAYTFPSHSQSSNLERSEADSSLDASTLPNINSNDPKVTRELHQNETNVGPLFTKGIKIGLLILIFRYIMMKILPLIWSLTFVIMMLIVRMIKSEVSDKVDGWIVKTFAKVCIHLFYVIFKRQAN